MGLIAEEGRQGVSTIVATPHFYAQEMSVKGFLERREEAFRRVMERLGGEEPSGRAPASLQTQADPNRAPSSLQTKGHPRILKGAEVYFFPGMGAAEALPSLTMEGTNVLLLEMPFAQWTGTIYEEVRRIIKEQHIWSGSISSRKTDPAWKKSSRSRAYRCRSTRAPSPTGNGAGSSKRYCKGAIRWCSVPIVTTCAHGSPTWQPGARS